MAKRAIRLMGNFEKTPHSSKRAEVKHCKHCGKLVRETVGNSGYCKKCIKLAREAL